MLCKECGYQFPRQEAERRTHEAHADNAAILSGEVTLETHDVTDVLFQVWTKRDAPEDAPHTVRVTYRCEAAAGSLYDAYGCSFSEWVCPEHMGFARAKFEKWWAARAAEVLVLAAPIYYFTMSAQIQAPIQRIYCMNKPGKLKKMALLASSYSPNVYDGAIGEYRGILNYWGVEDTGVVTAKIDEQKTDATRDRILELVGKL